MKNKTTAGLLAIFLGTYGVHDFYLGNSGKAIRTLLISLLTFGIGAIVMDILGIIDGVRILQMTDEEFQNQYDNMEGQNEKTVTQKNMDHYESLKKYKELYDMGALTEEEYKELKAKILQ